MSHIVWRVKSVSLYINYLNLTIEVFLEPRINREAKLGWVGLKLCVCHCSIGFKISGEELGCYK